ncbi:MAG: hypothetical protein ACXVCX_02315 [Ktedonobacterales bacterium]
MTQSFHNDNQNDDTRDVNHDHDTVSAAEEGNTDTNGASARHNDTVDDAAQSKGEEIRDIRTSRPRARRTSTRNVGGKRDTTEAKTDSGIIQFSERTARNDQQPADATVSTDDTEELAAIRTLDELKAQGFTADEAVRLIHVSDRLANGREARESQTTLRRLRFTRWLIEHGVLDEFTA